MSEAERYTSSEWQTLQFAPLCAFTAVAQVDGKIDDKEVDALTKEIGEAYLYKGTLIREVLTTIGTNVGEVFSAYRADSRTVDVGLREAADILDAKVDHNEAVMFKGAAVGIALNVAGASGSRFGSKISKDEEMATTLVGVTLRFEPAEFQRISPSYQRHE